MAVKWNIFNRRWRAHLESVYFVNEAILIIQYQGNYIVHRCLLSKKSKIIWNIDLFLRYFADGSVVTYHFIQRRFEYT